MGWIGIETDENDHSAIGERMMSFFIHIKREDGTFGKFSLRRVVFYFSPHPSEGDRARVDRARTYLIHT